MLYLPNSPHERGWYPVKIKPQINLSSHECEQLNYQNKEKPVV